MAPATAAVLGKVRALSTQRAWPNVRHTGIKNRLLCSMALDNAVALCLATTSTRWIIWSGTRLSSICSTTSAPTGTSDSSRRISSSLSSVGSGRGRIKGRTATVFECDSSTYSCTASSICGAMSLVSPVYQTGSPPATTALANRPNSLTVLDRLSNRSCPLTASIRHLWPRWIARLTRSHSINRRPSLAMW